MVVVTVPEMVCRHDVRAISAHLADVVGVLTLQLDLVKKTVTVDGNVSVEAVQTAIVAAGYAFSEASA